MNRNSRLGVLSCIVFPFLALFFAARAVAPASEVVLTPDERAAIASATNLSKAFVAVAKIIRPAVVNIKAEYRVSMRDLNDPFEFFNQLFGPRFRRSPPGSQTQESQGSGVIIDSRGYILTNNHVVGDADAVRVLILDGREFPAELIGSDPATDVAVIKIDADNLNVATMGDSDAIEVGEMVMAVGNPFGLDNTVTSGIVSARGRSGMNVTEIEDFIQTDASINPGNSGGPLVNLKGEVIGINTFIVSPNSVGSIGVGFAIPSNIARTIMQSLISHKQVTASYLGVETQPLTQELAQGFGLSSPRGALIKAVTKGSPGEKAGLRRGDVIVKWGKRDIMDELQLRNLVTITTPGEPVDVEVIRDRRIVLLTVTLIESPEEVLVEGVSERFLQNLGVIVTDLTPKLISELGYEPNIKGVLVAHVERGSPAHGLGMVSGSVIMSLNGKEVTSQQELRAAMADAARKKVYDIVWRTGNFTNRVRINTK